MKSFVFFILFACSIGQASAQSLDYSPMLVEGRVWNVQDFYYRCPPEYIGDVMAVYSHKTVYGLYISGDTIVDGMAYKTLLKDIDYEERALVFTVPADAPGIEQYQRWEVDVTEPCPVLLREADGKVFLRYNDKEELLFDFTLEIGDTFWGDQVEDVDTVCTTGGLYLRRQHLNYDVWVEGIGGPDGPLRNATSRTNGVFSVNLLSVYEGDNCIFTADDFSAPAVHGTTDNRSFPQASPQPVTAPFFDLQGRRLSGTPARNGLYIKDGRKVVVR